MRPTDIHLHTAFRIGRVDPRLFGGFLEQMGRSVYQGVYDPASAHADEDGFRTDVLEALRDLGVTVIRYPGGNFASGYHWADGVGPRDRRPAVLDLAWKSIEPNHFGTDEFLRLCRKLACEPMLTVNLGTGTPEEARNWVEYCNAPAGTRYADLRAANGSTEPHEVKLWCLGNEMDGPWQLGHVPAETYALRARQAARMMKNVDPSIELVACGSTGPAMSTYLDWDRTVLECLRESAEYVSLHRYVENSQDDTADFLAVTDAVERQIKDVDATCRYVRGRRKGDRRAFLSFDEWNVWFKNMVSDGAGQFAPHLLEEQYNLEDALVVAGFLNAFLRHADAVKIANLAQLVNVIAPIRTRGDEVFRQSIFHPFAMYSKRRGGEALRAACDGPTYEAPTHGRAAVVDAAAVLDERTLHVFAVNRSLDEEAELGIRLADAEIARTADCEIVTGPGPKAANSFEQPDVIRSAAFEEASVSDGEARAKLPALSVAALTFELT